MDLNIFEFLGREVPSSVSDIREALDLLIASIDGAIEQVGEKVNKSFTNKDFKKAAELSLNSEKLDAVNRKIQDAVSQLDSIIDQKNIEEDQADASERNYREIPNYSDYLVDTEIEHNLYEDLTHKRPCAIKIEGNRIEIKDWKSALLMTCNYLAQKDSAVISSFVDNSKMNGKKVIYFSRVKLPTMRAARKVENADIYIETNLSANGIRNLLVKMLNKYNIKLSDYKIFFKADYSDLH